MADESQGVVISLRQIYEELKTVHQEVTEMRSEFRGEVEDVADHEVRIRTLEKKVWVASGASAIGSAAITAVIIQGINTMMGV